VVALRPVERQDENRVVPFGENERAAFVAHARMLPLALRVRVRVMLGSLRCPERWCGWGGTR
jgi:hypothetical protein